MLYGVFNKEKMVNLTLKKFNVMVFGCNCM